MNKVAWILGTISIYSSVGCFVAASYIYFGIVGGLFVLGLFLFLIGYGALEQAGIFTEQDK